MLGGFEVWVGDTPAKCPNAPARLLCRLAVDANRPLPRSSLWQELWPDSDSGDVLDANLRRLRRDVLGSECGRLKSEGSTVLLDLAGADVDFIHFQELVKAGSISDLTEAVNLYRGEFLKRYLEDGWLLNLRDELKTDFEDALKTLAEHALREDEFLVAARYLRRFVESNPDYEWGWYKLLATYVRYGNRAEAIAVYAAYLDHMREGNLSVSKRIEALTASIRDDPLPRRDGNLSPISATVQLDERLTAGGALPSYSSFYVERREDSEVAHALATTGVTVRIKGARQTGKSSLLARALHPCRQAGYLVLLTDWQSLSYEALSSAENFFTALAHKLADQAKLDADPTSVFRPGRTPGDNFDAFIHRLLIPAVDRPIVWAIDEADRIFGCDFRDDVFGKMRSWHNERALDPDSPFARISLVLTYSTEAHLFITNLNQSPFNVGSVVELKDFTLAQSVELNEQYGGPLSRSEEVERLFQLVGGHPYLTSRALYEMKRRGLTIAEAEAGADQPDGPFHEHLERLRFTLGLNPELADAVRASLQEGIVPTAEQFLRLHAAGVMTGASPTQMKPRCSLYERYLRQALT